ncbi:MAG: Gfo/Idh/MocA family oxidoreductase [Pirellulaceae bacterium]
MNLTPDEKKVGRENYYEAMGTMDQSNYTDANGVPRRDFLKGVVAAGAVSGAGLGAMYFGYGKVKDPVRVGVIGTGDEGNVLIGAMNPDYVQVVSIAEIRPYNVYRAFHGDWASPAARAARPGLMAKYGWSSESEARKHVKVTDDYHELLNDPDVEGVIIALPLHLHAPAAVEAMLKGKHVLTEKLMGHNVAQCKAMARVAAETNKLLATGHQRHYSVLYDNAVNLIRWGVLGQLHYIRAQWHRGNLPGHDSWTQHLPGGEKPDGNGDIHDPIGDKIKALEAKLKREKNPERVELFSHQLAQWKAWDADQTIEPGQYGYDGFSLSNGEQIGSLEELCRWRLWDHTGGGLMAELGSHQLDAAGIFISALRADGKKSHPLSVHAVGGRHLFPPGRQAGDHVYCMFEFPGPAYDPDFPVGYEDKINKVPHPEKGIPGYDEDPNKKIVVTYSSINGNGFGGYGETVLGTKGTMILAREQEVMLYAGSDTSSNVSVKSDEDGPTMDTQASGVAAPVAEAAASTGPVSRGYTEEIEHWAWCIRNPDPDNVPRCHPKVALGDAVIALTANVAVKKANKGEGGYIQFKDSWYEVDSDETPDDSVVAEEYDRLTKKAQA